MSIEQTVGESGGFFIGEDKTVEFEVLSNDGKAVADPTKGVEDVATWTMRLILKKLGSNTTLLTKDNEGVGGLSTIGVYNATRATNTQRVRAQFADTDTDPLKKQTLEFWLWRTTSGAEAVLSHGTIELRR